MLNGSALVYERYHRIHAVTMKNTPITVGFVVIATAQLALGICLITLGVKWKSKAKLHTQKNYVSKRPCALRHGCTCAGQAFPPIPLDAYRLCIIVQHRPLEIAYTSVLLIYGASGNYPELAPDGAHFD